MFIAAEAVTGFGRTGKFFAMEHWGVEPDIAVFGKGASGGYSPLAGVVFQDKIYDGFAETGEVPVQIHTYVNYPLSARVGLDVLDIIEEENLLEHVTEMGEYLLQHAYELAEHPIIGDVRGMGLIFGFELVKDKETKSFSTHPKGRQPPQRHLAGKKFVCLDLGWWRRWRQRR